MHAHCLIVIALSTTLALTGCGGETSPDGKTEEAAPDGKADDIYGECPVRQITGRPLWLRIREARCWLHLTS